jgi:hypothetical protein
MGTCFAGSRSVALRPLDLCSLTDPVWDFDTSVAVSSSPRPTLSIQQWNGLMLHFLPKSKFYLVDLYWKVFDDSDSGHISA